MLVIFLLSLMKKAWSLYQPIVIGFIVSWLPDKPPGTILTRFVHTNAEFKFFFNLFHLCELHGVQELYLLVVDTEEFFRQFYSFFCAPVGPCPTVHCNTAKNTLLSLNVSNVSSVLHILLLPKKSSVTNRVAVACRGRLQHSRMSERCYHSTECVHELRFKVHALCVCFATSLALQPL